MGHCWVKYLFHRSVQFSFQNFFNSLSQKTLLGVNLRTVTYWRGSVSGTAYHIGQYGKRKCVFILFRYQQIRKTCWYIVFGEKRHQMQKYSNIVETLVLNSSRSPLLLNSSVSPVSPPSPQDDDVPPRGQFHRSKKSSKTFWASECRDCGQGR